MMDYTEALRVEYDPNLISYKELVEKYFQFHSPISLRSSRQYRSAIFYGTEEEKEICDEVLEVMQQKYGETKINLDVELRTEFYRAEEYHQNYLRMMGNARY